MSNLANLGEGSDRMDICGTLREYADLEKHSRYASTCMRDAASEIEYLRERVEAMNAVFGEIRIAVGSNGCSNYDTPEEPDPDAPWLPCGLVVKIGDVMEKEYRR